MKTVKLSRNYVIGSASFDQVTFREPKLQDYRNLGPVEEWQPSSSGKPLLISYPEAVWGYAERLLQDIAPGAIGELDLVDAMAIEREIKGFFREARGSLVKPASSSSGSDGTPSG